MWSRVLLRSFMDVETQLSEWYTLPLAVELLSIGTPAQIFLALKTSPVGQGPATFPFLKVSWV